MKIGLPSVSMFLFAAAVCTGETEVPESRPVGQPLPRTPTLNHVLRAVPAPASVVLDGDLRDWDLSGAIVLAGNIQEPRRLVRVAAMYDPDGLLLALQFKDRTPMVNHVDPVAAPGRAWCGDCVQLRFNTDPQPDQASPPSRQILHLDAYWYSDGRRPTAYAVYGDLSPGGKVERTIAEAEGSGVRSAYRLDADGQGYVQELRLAWKLLRPTTEIPFKAGESLRMAIEAMWGDSRYRDQPAARVTDLLNPRRPERDMIWANPQAFGTVAFMAQGHLQPSATGELWAELVRRFAELSAEAPAPVSAPVPAADRPCLGNDGPVENRLNAWYAAGTAAGNTGDFYDNRDREHSAIDRKAFPQLQSFEYAAAEKFANRDYGLFTGVRAGVTFGNSSTAAAPDRGGCNPRYAIMRPLGLAQLYQQYRGSNLYVYPAHHDYQPGRNGHGFYGDLLPVNSPYYLLSRGSSGSDIPFLNAAIRTAAAFSPEVRKLLVREGLLMPTLQYLLRSTYKANPESGGYFTGQAHPAVFDGALLDEARMVAAAHDMTAETVPPLAQVQVAETQPLMPGVNAPAQTRSERLCDSPCAVGFVFRRWERFLRLDAAAATSSDWKSRPLSFRWVLLQGLPERVRIDPQDGGDRARLTIAWHDRFPVQPGSTIQSNRVDIGVFAGHGGIWSAPAIVSVFCPDNELRTYDGQDRLLDVQYAGMDTTIGYETRCLLPAEGIPPYDIRDWREFLRLVSSPADSLCGTLSARALGTSERQALVSVSAELAVLTAQVAAERKTGPEIRGLNERWNAERRDAEKLSTPLLNLLPEMGGSVKDRLENMLNAWQNDPAWYLDNQPAMDTALTTAPRETRERIVAARDGLVALGIYRPDGNSWTLANHRGGTGFQAERLTLAERAEVKRFHLLLETRLVLPGVLVREPQFNYTDYRLLQARPDWLRMQYVDGNPNPSAIEVRAVASPPAPKPLEDP